MITDDPERITLYDLNAITALAFAKAVHLSRLMVPPGYPRPAVVLHLWTRFQCVSEMIPNHGLLTAAHVQRLLTLAQAAGLI